ncbi:PO21 protein, partial [Dyaphorophyia castanea]|nr:PO21 protein [Platysteira castanea]
LKQRRADPHIINLIKNTYENIYTCMTTKDEKSDPIKILKGVKKGDPVCPLLFSLVLDPLLCRLEKEGKGYQRGKYHMTATALADDLVLLSDSWEGRKENSKILETFCDLTGLKTQGEK